MLVTSPDTLYLIYLSELPVRKDGNSSPVFLDLETQWGQLVKFNTKDCLVHAAAFFLLVLQNSDE